MITTMTNDQTASLWTQAQELGMPEYAALMLVSIDKQTLTLLIAGKVVDQLPISTSRNGPGNTLDSYQTPTGFHDINERYGDGQPPGAILFERVATGEVVPPSAWQASSGKDRILTRILRLNGREPGVNAGGPVDTYERYVYLHGSDNEQHLGKQPSSQGCVHVGNHDIIELYDRIHEIPAWCWIG